MAYSYLLNVFLLLIMCSSTSDKMPKKSGWQTLFNGKDLSGWDTYLGPKYDSILKKRDPMPIGLNNDPSKVFSVVNQGNENLIRISGEHFGGISTTEEFENYHLQLQFKWGQLKWAPRKAAKKDSGLMYHAVGPHGADGGNWMRSHEFQIQQGDCGDYWGCAGAIFDVKAKKDNKNLYVYDETADMLSFGLTSSFGRHCVKFPDAEKPSGEWNTVDLYCFGATSVHVLNGKVIMVLHNSRQTDEGKETPLIKGKIQIQSEGAEVYYRNIKIRTIEKLPASLLEK